MSDVKKAWGALGRGDLLYFDPEDLVEVHDKKSALYDERIHLGLDEAHVLNVMEVGVIEPIVVRRNGENDKGQPIVEVVDGRQRRRWAMEANRRLKKAGRELIRVPGITRKGDDADMFGVMITLNEVRKNDDAMTRAHKLKRYLDMGRSEEDAAIRFGKSIATIKNLLSLLEAGPEVQEAVSKGKISIQAAKKLSAIPKEEQSSALEQVVGAGPGPAANEKADKIRGKRGKVRKRVVKTRSQIKEMRTLLESKKTSDPAQIGAAMLGWVLGDDEAIKAYKAIVNAAEEV